MLISSCCGNVDGSSIADGGLESMGPERHPIGIIIA
jgi:hypothetical protein